MDDYKKEELKEEIFQALWNEKTTAKELRSRAVTDEERRIVEQAVNQVEETDRNFRKGFAEGLKW